MLFVVEKQECQVDEFKRLAVGLKVHAGGVEEWISNTRRHPPQDTEVGTRAEQQQQQHIDSLPGNRGRPVVRVRGRGTEKVRFSASWTTTLVVRIAASTNSSISLSHGRVGQRCPIRQAGTHTYTHTHAHTEK